MTEPYALPGKNITALGPELTVQFKKLLEDQREDVIQLCLLAAGVRNEHLDPSGKRYSGGFETWWKSQSIDRLFKNRNNFSKYATAGDAIVKATERFTTARDQLPISMTALYEMAQLTDDQLKLCLQHMYTRTDVLQNNPAGWGGKKSKPLISPSATAASIKNWRMRWENPPTKSNEKRTVSFIKIKIHGSIYDMDNSGIPNGKITGSNIKEYVEKVMAVFSGASDTVLIENDLQKILNGIEYRKEKAVRAPRKKKGRRPT